MAFYECAQLLQLGFCVSVIATRLQCHYCCDKNKTTFANMVFHGSLVFYGSPLARAVPDREVGDREVGDREVGDREVGDREAGGREVVVAQ